MLVYDTSMELQLKKWLKELRLNESTISMILGGLVVVVVGVLIYNYFASIGKQSQIAGEASPSAQTQPISLPATHTVVKGEDLSIISQKYYGTGERWNEIAQANKLANPDSLVEGQTLIIPAGSPSSSPLVSPTPLASVTPSIAPASNVIEGTSYTVKAGEGLWDIAVRAYQDGYKWTKIAEANKDKIKNPNQLEKGMVLAIPR